MKVLGFRLQKPRPLTIEAIFRSASETVATSSRKKRSHIILASQEPENRVQTKHSVVSIEGKVDGQAITHAFYWQSLPEVILTMNPVNNETTGAQSGNGMNAIHDQISFAVTIGSFWPGFQAKHSLVEITRLAS
jgi:hypothetical protein